MNQKVLSYLLPLISIVNCSELISVSKGLEKSGLHRNLISNFTFTIENRDEYDLCNWIVHENITKDTYVYLEEVKSLKNFEFWPHTPIDIEKPSSVSKDH